MSEAIFRQNAGQQDYTPAAAATAGEIIQLDDGRAAVVKTDLAASEKGAVYTEGIFDVEVATGVTYTIGDPVWWDSSANTAIRQESIGDADFLLGMAVATKAAQLIVRVDLNNSPYSNGLIPLAVKEIDCATGGGGDTAVTIIPAAMNKFGLTILGCYGIISEVMAGSSEDQGVITIADVAGPTTICTITPSDAAADAVGDVVPGTVPIVGGTLGTLPVSVAADVGVTAVVSQLTVGTPAGKMKVRILAVPLI